MSSGNLVNNVKAKPPTSRDVLNAKLLEVGKKLYLLDGGENAAKFCLEQSGDDSEGTKSLLKGLKGNRSYALEEDIREALLSTVKPTTSEVAKDLYDAAMLAIDEHIGFNIDIRPERISVIDRLPIFELPRMLFGFSKQLEKNNKNESWSDVLGSACDSMGTASSLFESIHMYCRYDYPSSSVSRVEGRIEDAIKANTKTSGETNPLLLSIAAKFNYEAYRFSVTGGDVETSESCAKRALDYSQQLLGNKEFMDGKKKAELETVIDELNEFVYRDVPAEFREIQRNAAIAEKKKEIAEKRAKRNELNGIPKKLKEARKEMEKITPKMIEKAQKDYNQVKLFHNVPLRIAAAEVPFLVTLYSTFKLLGTSGLMYSVDGAISLAVGAAGLFVANLARDFADKRLAKYNDLVTRKNNLEGVIKNLSDRQKLLAEELAPKKKITSSGGFISGAGC